MSQVIAILEVPRDRFISLFREGNLLIFKEDIQLSNFVPTAADTSFPNEGAQQNPVTHNVENESVYQNPVTQDTQGMTTEVNRDTQDAEINSTQEEPFFYGDGWDNPIYRSSLTDGRN